MSSLIRYHFYLLVAVNFSRLCEAEIILPKPCNASDQDAFNAAIKSNDMSTVASMLRGLSGFCQTDPSMKSSRGELPLKAAIDSNNTAMTDILVRFDVDTTAEITFPSYNYSCNLFLYAVGYNRLEMARQFLYRVGGTTLAGSRDSRGYNGLHYSAAENFIDMANLIIYYKVPVDVQTTKERLTALHLACAANSFPMVINLLKNNAKVSIKDRDGHTAAFYVPHWSPHKEAIYAALRSHGAIIHENAWPQQRQEQQPQNRKLLQLDDSEERVSHDDKFVEDKGAWLVKSLAAQLGAKKKDILNFLHLNYCSKLKI